MQLQDLHLILALVLGWMQWESMTHATPVNVETRNLAWLLIVYLLCGSNI